VDIALPAEGVFHNLVFVSIKKIYLMQAYKIMLGLWGVGQMMFRKYMAVVDDDVDVHNTSEVASGSKLGVDATKKPPGEGFKRPWPPLIKMDESVRLVLKEKQATTAKWKWRPVVVSGGALTDEFKNAPWEKIRDEIYKGHGA